MKDNLLLWYCNKDIAILFDKIPKYNTLVYQPDSTTDEKKDINKKPYILTEDLNVHVKYNNSNINFLIPSGYRWNGANIPFGLWELILNPDDPKVRLASCIHDFMCEQHIVCNDNRYLSTLIFTSLCKVAGVSNIKCSIMFHAVDNYQKLFGIDQYGKHWGYYKKNNLI